MAAWGRRSALAFAVLCVMAGPLLAQGWRWPWESEPPPRQAPPPPPAYEPAPGGPPSQSANPWSANRSSSICLQLEQRLVQDGQRGNSSRERLPAIDAAIREGERAYDDAQAQLERRDCYEYFLFEKTLRRSRQCVDLASQAEDARRRVGDLRAQRQDILASGGQSNQDEIVRELARNNCGGNYAQDARRRDRGGFNPFWDDGEGGSGWGASQYGALPYSTYRTLCVRTCDGYYFPISFATLPNHFEQDQDACQSRCAAPAELFYYQNPGSGVDQMISFKTEQPYTSLRTAFRYRKELVKGCSCKEAEYDEKAAPSPESGASAPEAAKRAEAPKGAQEDAWSPSIGP